MRHLDDLIYKIVQPLSEWVEYRFGLRHFTQARFAGLCGVAAGGVHALHQYPERSLVDVGVWVTMILFVGMLLYLITHSYFYQNDGRHINFYRVHPGIMMVRLSFLVAAVLELYLNEAVLGKLQMSGHCLCLYLIGCQSLPPGKRKAAKKYRAVLASLAA
ncbi:hypothetical protein KC906_00960 [Candidatus Kaiserbacteria bacterium]|nr:hypothetical protein [Candidatus Kaiserbacteria bacterium]